MRPSDGLGGRGRGGRPRSAGRASRSPCSRRSAGSMNTQKHDDRRQRVAGQTEHERVAAAAEPQRLAGLDPHAPEDLLDAAGLERGLDVVVRADRDAAGDDQHVALQARFDRGDGGVALDRRSRRGRRRCAPARPASRRTISAVRLVDLARLGRRADRQQLAAGDDQVQARAAVHGRPRRRRPRRAPRPAGASARSPRAREHVARRAGPRRGARTCVPGTSARPASRCRCATSASSTARTASAPGGIAAPVETGAAVPGSSVARPRPRRPRRRRPTAATRRARCRPRAPRSRPSPSGRTAAGRPRRAPAPPTTRARGLGQRHALRRQRQRARRGRARAPRRR